MSSEARLRVDTLGELLHAATRRWAPRVALLDGARACTYGALGERAARVAMALGERGIRPGDRVAVFLDDRIETVEVFVACALGGFTLVPVNARFKASEATHVVHDSASVALVTSTALGDVAAAIDGLDTLRAFICIGAGDIVPGAETYERVLDAAAPLREPARVSPDDIAIIGYTSGTTGFPKGAQCSNRSVVACTRLVPMVQGMLTNGACAFTGSFSFVSALWGILFPHLYTGASVRLLGATDVESWVAMLEHDGATYTWVPSPLVREFRDEVTRRPGSLARLRTVVHTGSKVPPEFLASLVDVVGERLVETWGLTESIGPLTATNRSDFTGSSSARDVFSSVGRPVPTAEVAVLGADGRRTTAADITGELVARADTLFSGYLGRPRDDPESFDPDGWFRTGDVGRFDAAGYVYIEDRSKDVIVSGGMNVYPAEVELAIATMAGVAECAVYGVPDDRWGETVAASVVRRAGASLDEHDVIAYVKARLASYKKPTSVRFVDALPRNASMKVQKQILRAAHPPAL